MVCCRGAGMARRQAAPVSCFRSARPARSSTPPSSRGAVTRVTQSRGPRLRALSSRPITPSHSHAVPSTARAIQRSRLPSLVSSEPPRVRAASVMVAWITRRKAHGSDACVLGLRGSYHRPRCVVVGWPVQEGQRYRLGRSSTQTSTSNTGRWRRRTTASHPCRSRISRPQRRHRVPARVLSTRMSQGPGSGRGVERTRISGKSHGPCRRWSIVTPTGHLGRDHLPRVLPRAIRPGAHHGSSGRANILWAWRKPGPHRGR